MPAKRLHTGRSRNDQVALDVRMYAQAGLRGTIGQMLADLLEVAAQDTAPRSNLNTVMPGYTHLQKAQPITPGYHLMAYFQMFKRDCSAV